jgi:CHAT domain-containing protein/Flp pilus assembly protein TadD
MASMDQSACRISLLLVLAAAACGPVSQREARPPLPGTGLVVERVTPGGAGALAGVEVGDVLVSWQREGGDGIDASGDFLHPFDPLWVEVLHGARGGVTLAVARRDDRGDSAMLELPISGNTWRLLARPLLPAESESAYRAALAGVVADDPRSVRGAAAALEELARELPAGLRVAATVHAGRLLRELAPGDDTGEFYRRALEVAEASGDSALHAWACHEAGWAMHQARRPGEALRFHERALGIYRQTRPGSLLEANALNETALLRAQTGDLEPAIAAMREVLALRQRLAPDSLVVAASLNNLGNYVSDLAQQQRYHEEALALRERLAPRSLDTALSLNNLGNVAWARGDLRRAEELLARAQALLEELDAPPRFRGGVAGNLALVARERGDLAGAEVGALEALRIFERHEPRGPFHAEVLNTIGLIRRQRADLAGAEASFREALEVARAIEESSPRSVNALLNLGGTLSELGRHEEAERVLREGGALQESLDPRSVTMAGVWTVLANVARERGDAEEEARLLRAALVRWEEQAPESLLVARALDHLGVFLSRQGALDTARAAHMRALALADGLAPGSLDEARFAHHLGRVRRLQGHAEEAVRLYARAIAALESQAGRLGGGDETRTQFRAANRELYQEYVELLLEQELVEEAFAALERSRAQAFVAMLAERDLVFGRELPEELATRRSRLERDYDHTLGELATLSLSEGPARALALRERLLGLRRQHEALVTDVRDVAPELASLRYPRPPAPGEASRALGPGSLLLEFRVGESESQLFALSGDGTLTVHPIDAGERQLATLVGRLLILLRAGAAGSGGDEAVDGLGRELYQRLISPAAARLDGAQHLVIVPDGPLHGVPFAALVDPESDRRLIERFAYVVVPSAAALARLLEHSAPSSGERGRTPPESRGAAAVAFGDPMGEGSPSLPWARAEVRSIERALNRPVSVFLGADATEERVEALGGRVPYLHFAVHGRLDSHSPLDSALVLAPTRASHRNGLLQAWEVLERVRVDADLAVLTGCENAHGEERAGEGLVGLVRAFHFAGARAVVASLWRVPDRGTAVLMSRLYHHLEAGATPSEALRAAQLELLHAAPEARAALADLTPRSLRQRIAEWLGIVPAREDGGAERLRDPAVWAAFQVHGAER